MGYVPTDRIVGLSKIPRIVHHFARGLQNQERLVQQVANCLVETLRPNGVGVILHARRVPGLRRQNRPLASLALLSEALVGRRHRATRPPNTWSQPPVPCSSSSEVLHFGTSDGFLTVLNNLATTSEAGVCGNGT